MNGEILLRKIGEIDDADILHSETMEKRKPRLTTWISAAAASLVLIFGTLLVLSMVGKNNGSHKSELPKFELVPEDWASAPTAGKTAFDIPSDLLSDYRSANVYKALPYVPDEDVISRIAELLEIDIQQVYFYSEEGHFSADKIVTLEPAKEQMYEDEVYLRIAREFLEATGLPLENYLETKVYKNDFTYTDNDDEWDAFHLVEVQFFYRPIDGIDGPILGTRTSLVVGMTNDGEVVEFYGNIWSFTEPSQYPLLPIEDVIMQYEENREDTVIYSNCPVNGGTATEVYLVYYLTRVIKNGVKEWSLIPVYVFRGATEKGHFITMTRAISTEYSNIGNVVLPEMG